MCSKNVNEANSAQSSISNPANIYFDRDENTTQSLVFFNQRQTILTPTSSRNAEKSHRFCNNIDIKYSPVTPAVLGIHSAIQEWWTAHGRRQDTPFPPAPFTKFPGRTAQLHVGLQTAQYNQHWLPKHWENQHKAFDKYMDAPRGRTTEILWLSQQTEQNSNIESSREKGEITCEDGQSLRKKKPRELRRIFSWNSGVQPGLLEANTNFIELLSILSSVIANPWLNGCQTMQQSAPGDFYGFTAPCRNSCWIPKETFVLRLCDSWAVLAEPLQPPGWGFGDSPGIKDIITH